MRRLGSRFTALIALVAVAALMGVLSAGLLLPLVGGAGVAAKSAAQTFEALPTNLTMPELAQRTEIFAADGTPIASFFYQNRQIVALKSVPKAMQNAIVAIEDSRFYQDNGIDLKGILRAGLTDVGRGTAAQGASTITQQLVKNILVQSATTTAEQQAATSDSLGRKLREARYAIALDKKLTKQQILERYLNIVYFGDGAYGVAAAARRFFGESVTKLKLPQAALLAGLVQNPSGYDPLAHPQAARDRRDTVLERMQQLGYLTATQEKAATSAPLGLHPTTPDNGCADSWAPFFCDYVIQQVLADPSLGSTVDDRRRLLLTGGLRIYTTLDPKAQKAAQRAVDHVLPPNNRNNGTGIATAADTVDPKTGGVVAMAVDRKYGHENKRGYTEVNYATGGSSGYQAGSTFKMFVLATAIQQGISLGKSYNCPHRYYSKDFPDDHPFPYPVDNAGDSEAGTFDIVEATWLSVNTCYVQIEGQTGAAAPAELAQKMGVRAFPDQPIQPHGSFFLGTTDTTPLAMAGAYATLADRGVHCAVHGIARVTDPSGKVLQNAKPSCTRVLSEEVADKVTGVLQGVIDGPDPYRTGVNAAIGRPAAGKTGTTDDEQEAWFVGYTPDLATAVWVGDPRGPVYPLHDITALGHTYSVVYGGDLPAIIWSSTMKAALAGVPEHAFAQSMIYPSQVDPAPPPPPAPTTTSPAPTTPPAPPPPTTKSPAPPRGGGSPTPPPHQHKHKPSPPPPHG